MFTWWCGAWRRGVSRAHFEMSQPGRRNLRPGRNESLTSFVARGVHIHHWNSHSYIFLGRMVEQSEKIHKCGRWRVRMQDHPGSHLPSPWAPPLAVCGAAAKCAGSAAAPPRALTRGHAAPRTIGPCHGGSLSRDVSRTPARTSTASPSAAGSVRATPSGEAQMHGIQSLIWNVHRC